MVKYALTLRTLGIQQPQCHIGYRKWIGILRETDNQYTEFLDSCHCILEA